MVRQCLQTYWERSTNFVCSENILILTLQDRPILDKHLHLDHVRGMDLRKNMISQETIMDPFESSLDASLFQIMGQMIFFLFWSFPISVAMRSSFLITFSGIERRSNVHSMKPRLATISYKRCPHVQQTMPSVQYDGHSLHCVLGSVSNSSNSSTLPTSWIICLSSYWTGL